MLFEEKPISLFFLSLFFFNSNHFNPDNFQIFSVLFLNFIQSEKNEKKLYSKKERKSKLVYKKTKN